MRAYTHWGLGTPTASQHNIFDLEKLTNFSCAPDRVQTLGQWIWSSNLRSMDMELDALPTSHPLTPVIMCGKCGGWAFRILQSIIHQWDFFFTPKDIM